METYLSPNSPEYLAALRVFLRDLPTSPGFEESVRLVGQAFHSYDARENLALSIDSNDLPFFGRDSIVSLFGENYPSKLWSRKFNMEPEDYDEWQPEPQMPRDLRNRVDRFVVVGFAAAPTTRSGLQEYPKKMIFRAGMIGQKDSTDRPIQGREEAAESVRVRGGQMNRRQALLLTHHLNSFHRNPRRHQLLTWRAVKGPEPNTSSREWLDNLGGNGQFLRRLLGDIPGWGLGEHTLSEIAVYDLERAASWHGEQVFAYRRPRYVMPARYEVSYVHRERPRGVPDGEKFLVRRGSPCAAAYAMASAYVQAGFIDDCASTSSLEPHSWGEIEDQTLELWPYNPDVDGAPSEYSESGDSAPFVYSTGLSAREAREVSLHLRRLRHKDVRVNSLGLGGHFSRECQGTLDFWSRKLSCVAALGSVGSDGQCFKAVANFELPDRYVADAGWPQWAREYAEDERSRRAVEACGPARS